MVPHKKIFTNWSSYKKDVEKEIRQKYTNISTGDYVKTDSASKSNVTRIWVYTDKPRITEITSLLNNKESFLYSGSKKTLSYGRAAPPSHQQKISSVGIIEVTSYAYDNKKLQIIFKPRSSYFGGRGKLNEKNFIESILKAQADIDASLKPFVIIRFREKGGNITYPVTITRTTTTTDISATTGKGDVKVGSHKISLKMPSADYVASLNQHTNYIKMGHNMLKSLANQEKFISYNGNIIHLNAFPFLKIKKETQKKELLFSSGRSSDAGTRDTYKTSYKADVVIIHDFADQKVTMIRSGVPEESHIFDVEVTRIITDSNIGSLADTDFDIHLFIRNAEEKGQPFGSEITSKADFLKWLDSKDNATKIPKGVRLTAVFAKKNTQEHLEVF